MSVLWFIILSIAWHTGIKIDDISFLMISIFYIGDCILMGKGGRNNELHNR